jgi:integrase
MEFLLYRSWGVVDLAPRRSQDYKSCKLEIMIPRKTIIINLGNFIQCLKTAKRTGYKVIDVPKELNVILKKWVKINTNDYMLYSTNGNKLSSPQVTRILNKVFDKNVSSSMLRHIYLTNKYKDIPALSKMEEVAADMGHSVKQAMEYIKR